MMDIHTKGVYNNFMKRINVVLPDRTLRLVNGIANKGSRSHFIDEAIWFYIRQRGREGLRRQLKEGAIKGVERDRELAEEWFPLEQEMWQEEKK